MYNLNPKPSDFSLLNCPLVISPLLRLKENLLPAPHPHFDMATVFSSALTNWIVGYSKALRDSGKTLALASDWLNLSPGSAD